MGLQTGLTAICTNVGTDNQSNTNRKGTRHFASPLCNQAHIHPLSAKLITFVAPTTK